MTARKPRTDAPTCLPCVDKDRRIEHLLRERDSLERDNIRLRAAYKDMVALRRPAKREWVTP